MYLCVMKKAFDSNRGIALLLVSLLLCCAGAVGVQAQTCEGRVCLKDGNRQLYAGNDRLDMPRKKHDVQVYRNFFSRQCQRDVVPADRVDSIVVWNSTAQQGVRILVPLEGVGWSWLYVSRPRMQVYVYASQGYSLSAMGGMRAQQGNSLWALLLIPHKTACDFYVLQPGGKPVCLGDAYKKCDKAFIRRLCHCAGLTPEQERELMEAGERNRSAMIQRVVDIMDGEHTNQKERRYNESNQSLAVVSGSNGAGHGRTRTQE